jgi:hypothetical protein
MSCKVRKAVIPAAGFGTRFLPFTKSVPKELIPLVDKPVIQYVVEEAVASGIEEILLVISSDKESIIRHFNPVPELERRLTESFHQDAPEYRRALERYILNSGDLHDWLLPQTLMVVGEGMTYCPLPEMRWEEKSSDYWELVKLNANLLAKQGCWGAMLRTNSGPEDPVWQEYPEKLHQANTAFLHG